MAKINLHALPSIAGPTNIYDKITDLNKTYTNNDTRRNHMNVITSADWPQHPEIHPIISSHTSERYYELNAIYNNFISKIISSRFPYFKYKVNKDLSVNKGVEFIRVNSDYTSLDAAIELKFDSEKQAYKKCRAILRLVNKINKLLLGNDIPFMLSAILSYHGYRYGTVFESEGIIVNLNMSLKSVRCLPSFMPRTGFSPADIATSLNSANLPMFCGLLPEISSVKQTFINAMDSGLKLAMANSKSASSDRAKINFLVIGTDKYSNSLDQNLFRIFASSPRSSIMTSVEIKDLIYKLMTINGFKENPLSESQWSKLVDYILYVSSSPSKIQYHIDDMVKVITSISKYTSHGPIHTSAVF